MLILGYTVPAWNYRQGDCESQESLGYAVRLHYGKKKTRENSHTLGMWLIGRLFPLYAQGSAFAPSTIKTGCGGVCPGFQKEDRTKGHPQLHSDFKVYLATQ